MPSSQQTPDQANTTAPHPADVALAVLSPLVIALSLALHDYVQAGVVLILFVVSAAKALWPEAEGRPWSSALVAGR